MNIDLIEQTKQQAKQILPSFIHLASVIFIIILLKPEGITELLLTITTINIIKNADKVYQFKEFILNIIKSTIILFILYTIMFISLGYGFTGFAIYILLLSLWVMFGSKNKRNNFMAGLRNIETAMFGKPLDKEEWNDDKPSVKIKLKRD